MQSKFIQTSVAALLIGAVCLWGPAAMAQGQRSGGGSTGGGMGGGGGGTRTGGGGGMGGGSSSSSSGTTRSYNNNTMMGDAYISSDTESRRIIVITDAETEKSISQVVSNLDRPKPQVLINVVFLQVEHDDGLDVGFEGGYSRNLGTSSSVLNLTNMFGLASDGFTTPGAGMYSIVGNGFTATLRAIKNTSKMEVLSRPSIMVRNNQPATILVGEQVPVITGTTITSGTSQTSYEYKNTGIELQVTPFITPDGLVEMIVAPSISAVESSKTQAISTNVSVPYIATRSANTVVVTPDRQPIVIGGLIDKDKETSDHKIPLLGDIPYLGALFTRHVVTDTKRELIIFLTPHVVRYSGEISGVVKTEADRFEMISKSSSEKELDKFIDEIPINMQKKSSKK